MYRSCIDFGWENYKNQFDVVKCYEIFSERYDYRELYGKLVPSFGLNVTYDFFCFVLDHDPSNVSDFDSGDSFYREKPVPRYFVSIVYLILNHCLAVGPENVGFSVWNNLVRCRHHFSAEILRGILEKFFQRNDVLQKSIELFSSGKNKTNEYSLFVLSCLKFDRGRIMKELMNRINREHNSKKKMKFSKAFMKYFNPIMI